MSISQQELDRRYAAIRELMKRDELDCLLVTGYDEPFSRGNIRYITNYGKGRYCVFPSEGAPILIIPGGHVSPKIHKVVGNVDIRPTPNPIEEVKQELSRFDKGNKIGIVGMEQVSVPMYLAVKEQFRDRLVDSVRIFEQLRLIKSPEEIEKMRIAASIADKVFTVLRDMVHPGLSDYEIYGEVSKIIHEMGCEYSFELIDAEGAKMNFFHPTGDKLEANGTLFMEITPAYEGYYAQLPVTLPVGDYPPHISKMIRVWAQAMEMAVKILRPGTKVSDVYYALVNTIRQEGYLSPLRPGHAIGLDVIDFWSITESNTTILKSGMTLALHPSVFLEIGGDGIGMGYTYLITDTGGEKLSKVDLLLDPNGNKIRRI